MKSNEIFLGVAVAGMLAGLSSCASNSYGTRPPNVVGQCFGINSCKGKGACGSKSHSCAGKNSCHGKGWVKKTQAQCEDAGGEFRI